MHPFTEPEGAPQAQTLFTQKAWVTRHGQGRELPTKAAHRPQPAPPKTQDGGRGLRPDVTTQACSAPELMSRKSHVRSPQASRD